MRFNLKNSDNIFFALALILLFILLVTIITSDSKNSNISILEFGLTAFTGLFLGIFIAALSFSLDFRPKGISSWTAKPTLFVLVFSIPIYTNPEIFTSIFSYSILLLFTLLVQIIIYLLYKIKQNKSLTSQT
jgi:hypothetical protein